MQSPARREELRKIPIFAELGPSSLERIATAATEIEVAPGQVLIQPHEPGSGMYVVEEGTVAVELRGQTIELGPGEFFGELSLLVPEATRSGRVRAATRARCLAISRADFEELVGSEPRLALAMLRVLARRLLIELGAL
jgi:voltage-gated potassium channel